jgi:GR25 family glycosyltransferase involved in LPS biosynthesis
MFTKVLWINLDRRTDRKIHMEKELKKIHLNCPTERVSAVDGRTLTKKDLEGLLDDNSIEQFLDTTDKQFAPGSYMTKGAAGCVLSHYKCWNKIVNGNNDLVLVLEDDIIIDNNFIEKLNIYLKEIPNYDLLYIGYHDSLQKKKYTDNIHIPEGVVFGTFGYIISKNGAKKMLEMFPVKGQIDSQMSRTYSKIKAFNLNKGIDLIVSEDSRGSTLGTDIQIIEKFQDLENSSNPRDPLHDLVLFIILFILIYLFLSRLKL